jgi:CRP-like cAMP-binding protein
MNPFIQYLSRYIRVLPEEEALMLNLMHYESYGKRSIISRQDEVSGRAAFIIKGAVRSYYTDSSGEEHTVGFSFENEPLVAIDSFLRQTPCGKSAMALENTELIWVSRNDFYQFIGQYQHYEKVIIQIMSESFTVEGERSRLLRIHSSRERYETLLRSNPEIIRRVPLKHIASYLGMALETLSRVRAGKL